MGGSIFKKIIQFSKKIDNKYFGPKLFRPKAYPAQTFPNRAYPATCVSSELLRACLFCKKKGQKIECSGLFSRLCQSLGSSGKVGGGEGNLLPK